MRKEKSIYFSYMRQQDPSGAYPESTQRGMFKAGIINLVVALICILVYILAVALAAVKIFINVSEFRELGWKEFYGLVVQAERVVPGDFLGQPYQDNLRDALGASRTLRGIIISGPGVAYLPIEQARGDSISWIGTIPRFRQSFGLSRVPYEAPLKIPEHEGFSIQASYSTIDQPFFVKTLKRSLIMIGGALALAVFTLLSGAVLRKDSRSAGMVPRRQAESGPVRPSRSAASHKSLSPEAFMTDCLTAELRRASSSGQDLVLIMFGIGNRVTVDGALYRRLTGEAAAFFGSRNLVFERGDRWFSVLIPGNDLDQGLTKAEDFHYRILETFPAVFPDRASLCAGISSRSERSVDAQRLMVEAGTALEKALKDDSSPIIAFRIDPEKYRTFMDSQSKRNS